MNFPALRKTLTPAAPCNLSLLTRAGTFASVSLKAGTFNHMSRPLKKTSQRWLVPHGSLKQILEVTARVTGTPAREIIGKERYEPIVMHRHLFCHVALQSFSSCMIGNFMGKDHTSVLHAEKRIQDDRESSEAARTIIDEYTRLIRSEISRLTKRT